MKLKALYGFSLKYLRSLAQVASRNISSWAHTNILVYAGPGTGPKSLANIVQLLQDLVADQYTIKLVDSDTIINGAWIDDTALLVMPGGADIPYLEKLAGVGNQNIREYVQNGGKYLGICAGAYYAADSIEFAKGDPRLEVIAERELKFYRGTVQGPTYAGFDYVPPQNIAGMRAAKIFWQAGWPFVSDQEFVVYYNGGGHFVAAEQYPQVTILARYDSEIPNQSKNLAAIIECKHGSGTAILSGLHFEWGADSLYSTDPRLVAIKSTLFSAEQDRLALSKHLLERLAIALHRPQ